MAASMHYARNAALLAFLAVPMLLTGCETGQSIGKRIDYKSTSNSPPLEVPPDLTTPRFDDRYAVTTASGLSQQNAASKGRNNELLPVNPEAKIVRAGSERWLVVKATPEQAWGSTRQFWIENGFVLASEQPTVGLMETDWAENRADLPADFLRRTVGKYIDVFSTTYKRDKFRSRIERGAEPNTIEIYVSHRGMEQIPTAKIDNSSPAGFAWALMPPNPELEAEMLTRLMLRFGTNEPQAQAAVAQSTAQPERARLQRTADGAPQLVVDDTFDRAWRRVGLALDRTGFTVVDRDRSKGLYFVRYADVDSEMARKDKDSGFLSKLMFWKTSDEGKPEQYRIFVAEAAPRSLVSVQDPNGKSDKTPASEKILGLLQDQLK